MIGGRSDLPLSDDSTGAYLPWLVAPMVFLSAVALAGVFILNTLIGSWDRDVAGTLTVEIAAAPGEAAESAERTRGRVEQALKILENTPGIARARALSQEQLVTLLAPWLGSSDLLKELPLPALLDVTLEANDAVNLAELGAKLAKAVPGASLDDHRIWLNRLIHLSRAIEWLAIAVVVLIGAVTSATVYFATGTAMAVHREVIEVMHLIGAADGYIAGQFASRAVFLGFKGGMIGLCLTLPVILGIAFGTDRLEGGFLSDLSLPLIGWIAVLILPPVAALLAGLTARAAVYRTLAKML